MPSSIIGSTISLNACCQARSRVPERSRERGAVSLKA